MQGMLDHFGQILVGRDPRQIEHLWQTLYRGHYFEGGKIAGAVVSAIDIALYDILGQSLGVPVYQLLGGACRSEVGCFATPGGLTGPAVVEQARAAVAEGWRFLRFGPGMPEKDWTGRDGGAYEGWTGGDGSIYEPMESLALAAHWIREVRNAVGPAVGLSIDFHHRLSVAEAALFCQQVADVNLMFIEEPIRAQSPEAYQQLRTMTPIPFAIGEEFASKWEFLPYVERGILNFARIDVSNVGGFTRGEESRGLVRGALHRRDAAQPARPGLHRRDDPLLRRDQQLRAVGVFAPQRRRLDGRSLPYPPDDRGRPPSRCPPPPASVSPSTKSSRRRNTPSATGMPPNGGGGTGSSRTGDGGIGQPIALSSLREGR